MTDNKKPTREEAEAAVRTMLAWTGDNPDREGLVETPKRVVRAYEQFFAGYEMDPKEVLSKVFEEVEGYDEMVIVRIFVLNLIVSIILFPSSERHMLVIYQTKELLALVNLPELLIFLVRDFKPKK